jgi:hypothetical protein
MDPIWEQIEPAKVDVSFGESRESNPALLSWLTTYKLEEYYDTLLNAGYDDIELMAE